MTTVAEKPKMRPPRDGLVRARPGLELRSEGDDEMPTLTGHFARFNEWTEIDSIFEGRFMERIAPGAFKKTFSEQRTSMKVTLNHGHDPHLGDKPLGPIDVLREDDTGGYYEVPLIDTSYNRDLIPGLEAGLYGASFRFRVVKEAIDEEPERSDSNPDAIPERTITEAQVFEFGPVTFPAYEGATAGVRSMTDEMLFERMASDPDRMRELLDFAKQARALSTDDLPSPEEGEDKPEAKPPESTPEEEPAQPTPRSEEPQPLYGHQDKKEESWRL